MSNLWEQIWRGKNRKCGDCGKFVALRDTAKSSYSFKIVCQRCYNHPKIIIVIDEFASYPGNNNWRETK